MEHFYFHLTYTSHTLTFSPTPIPRKKFNAINSLDNSQINESLLNDTKNSFDLIVSLDPNNANMNFITSTMPLPRKPRKNYDSKQSTLKLDEAFNQYEETQNETFCFFNSSYEVSNKLIGTSSQYLLKEIQEILPDHYISIDKYPNKTNSFKLQRPIAPPPPPPKIHHSLYNYSKNSYLNSTKISMSKLTSTPKYHENFVYSRRNFINIGFDNLSLSTCSNKKVIGKDV